MEVDMVFLDLAQLLTIFMDKFRMYLPKLDLLAHLQNSTQLQKLILHHQKVRLLNSNILEGNKRLSD